MPLSSYPSVRRLKNTGGVLIVSDSIPPQIHRSLPPTLFPLRSFLQYTLMRQSDVTTKAPGLGLAGVNLIIFKTCVGLCLAEAARALYQSLVEEDLSALGRY